MRSNLRQHSGRKPGQAGAAIQRERHDRFAGVAWRPSLISGAPVLEGVVAWLDCRITGSVAAGDHDLVLAHVDAAAADPAVSPLLFHRTIMSAMPDSVAGPMP
ncbi:flavin reductase family protein [Melissospora conviva]|uniref:flavin reductase family protein n=1 Tax=Melissospora conviva TaxID=3388432 RepID=UPI003C1DCC17